VGAKQQNFADVAVLGSKYSNIFSICQGGTA